ncbi:MAG TPA: cytochrome c [Patescibacteria group bacterium]|nr:cytochrome c [Patescibacteria group bacterium]
MTSKNFLEIEVYPHAFICPFSRRRIKGFHRLSFASLLVVWISIVRMPLAAQIRHDKPGEQAGTNILLRLDEIKSPGPVSRIEVAYDPVYQRRKTYLGLPFEIFLRAQHIRIPDEPGIVVEFRCQDGYCSIIPLALLLRENAFLATADAEAPEADKWLAIPGLASKSTPGPYYLVWPRNPGDGHLWPYQITTLQIRPAEVVLRRAAPASSARLAKGFELFQKNCMSCHSINGVGGTLGVELNVPQNVFEYWQPEKLAAYVSNPASFRVHSKMPSFAALGDKNIALILEYVRHMKTRKQKE